MRLVVFFILFNALFLGSLVGQSNKEITDSVIKKAKAYQLTSWDSAFYYADIGYQTSMEMGYLYGAGISKLIMSNSKKVSKQRVETLLEALEGVELLRKADTTDYFNMHAGLRNMASVYGFFKSYQEAIEHYDLALEALDSHIKEHPYIADKMGDHKYINVIKRWKAINLRRAGKIEEAISVFSRFRRSSL